MLKKQETQLIVGRLKAGMIFLGVGHKNGIFWLLHILKNKNVQVYAFDFPKKENSDFSNFFKKNSIGQVDVMRVDVNGREMELFMNAQKLFSSGFSPVIFYSSFENNTKRFNYHPVEIMWFLQDFGYKFFILDGKTGKIIPRPPYQYEGIMIAAKEQIL